MAPDAGVNPMREGALTLRAAVPSERRFQELWPRLADGGWGSLAVVPCDPAGNAAEIARALAEVGTRLGEAPVVAVAAEALDYASARDLLELQRRTASTRVVLALPPVLVEPLGLAVARAADAVLLTVVRGRTRLADVRRTVELVGRERLLGCVLVGG
jgi:hypothetical protein